MVVSWFNQAWWYVVVSFDVFHVIIDRNEVYRTSYFGINSRRTVTVKVIKNKGINDHDLLDMVNSNPIS